jgi:hypothetical protein
MRWIIATALDEHIHNKDEREDTHGLVIWIKIEDLLQKPQLNDSVYILADHRSYKWLSITILILPFVIIES